MKRWEHRATETFCPDLLVIVVAIDSHATTGSGYGAKFLAELHLAEIVPVSASAR